MQPGPVISSPGTAVAKPPLSVQLAKASWIAPLVVVGMNILVKAAFPLDDATGTRSLVIASVALVLYFLGLICGIAALFGISKHGWKGILIPAGIGIFLNFVIIVIMTVIVASSFFKTAIANKPPEAVQFLEGQFSISRPGSWSFLNGRLNDSADLEMGNLAREAYCTILSESKMDFDEDVDLEQFSQIASGILVNSLENPKVEGPYNLNIVDYPAVKYEILGSINNTRIRYWHVSVDLGSYYHQVLLWSLPSRFEKNQPDFEEVLRSFRSEEP